MSFLLNYSRPLVMFVGGYGDQLISLPAMRALGKLFPGAIQLIFGEGNLSFFYRDVPLRGSPRRAWWKDPDELAFDLDQIVAEADPCDLFICLSLWTSPSVVELGRRLGANRTIGFFDCFDEPVQVRHATNLCDRTGKTNWDKRKDKLQVKRKAHISETIFALPLHIDSSLRFDDFTGAPVFSPAAEGAAARHIARIRAPGERLLFVHTETKSYKTWPRERFAWVLDRFLRRRSEYKVVLPSLESYPLDIHPGRIIRVHEHLELAMAMLRHANLFLGIDSCFFHAADFLRIPGVGLFAEESGPVSEWGFRLSPHGRHVTGDAMDTIEQETVLTALLELAEMRDGETESRSSYG